MVSRPGAYPADREQGLVEGQVPAIDSTFILLEVRRNRCYGVIAGWILGIDTRNQSIFILLKYQSALTE